VIYTVLLLIFISGWAALPGAWSALCLVATFGTFAMMSMNFEFSQKGWSEWHEKMLANALPFTALAVVAVFIGGLVQIIPTVMVNTAKSIEGVRQIPYTPLELAGRDIYIREGCYTCHSQQIRTLVGDVLRYGEDSKLGESIYDHPYQWGSKRIGPDLGQPSLDTDPRFATIDERRRNQASIWEMLGEFARKHTKREMMAILNELNVPCGPIMSTEDLFNDEHVKGREMMVELDHPQRGKWYNVGMPIKLSASPSKSLSKSSARSSGDSSAKLRMLVPSSPCSIT
jgi:hypothetical protein